MKAGIYRAVKGDTEIVGNPREIEDLTGINYTYVPKLARTGTETYTGWKVFLVTPADRGAFDEPREYLAECEGEDPIIGPASEIAALTGIDPFIVNKMVKDGISFQGWSVKPYKSEEQNGSYD